MKFYSFFVFLLSIGILVVKPTDIVYKPTNNKQPIKEILRCYLCKTSPMHGQVSDCHCEFDSVNAAINNFFVPTLGNITSRFTYKLLYLFYFDRECPFWQEEGQCMFEDCSVGSCDISEIPTTWMNLSSNQQYQQQLYDSAWVSERESSSLVDCQDSNHTPSSLSCVSIDESSKNSYITYLESNRHHIKEDDWTDMVENMDDSLSGKYVNLLENPERFTGYSGPSARRVWQSIVEENCFGDSTDVCLEKRVFYRLMSGLRSSISTHIAREYYFHDTQKWGVNLPLYIQAVGMHQDRVDNLYFTFLFLLRSVTKAKDVLLHFPYDTGNITEDSITRTMVQKLLLASNYHELQYSKAIAMNKIWSGEEDSPMNDFKDVREEKEEEEEVNTVVEECRNGFDESALFQVSSGTLGTSTTSYDSYSNSYSNTQTNDWQSIHEKNILLQDFRNKFRNITRIMDCVTCEKCRLWGKLQILGIGTAIKILLSTAEEIHSDHFLTRQEVIALINVLHQISKSVEFVSMATDVELEGKLKNAEYIGLSAILSATVAMIAYIYWYKKNIKNRKIISTRK